MMSVRFHLTPDASVKTSYMIKLELRGTVLINSTVIVPTVYNTFWVNGRIPIYLKYFNAVFFTQSGSTGQ